MKNQSWVENVFQAWGRWGGEKSKQKGHKRSKRNKLCHSEGSDADTRQIRECDGLGCALGVVDEDCRVQTGASNPINETRPVIQRDSAIHDALWPLRLFSAQLLCARSQLWIAVAVNEDRSSTARHILASQKGPKDEEPQQSKPMVPRV